MAKKATNEVINTSEEVISITQEAVEETVLEAQEEVLEEVKTVNSDIQELAIENEIIEEVKEQLPKKTSKTVDTPRILAQQQAKQAHIDFQEAEKEALNTAQKAIDLKKDAELEAINAQEAIERTLAETKKIAHLHASNAMAEVLKTKKEKLAKAEEVRRESLRLEEVRQQKQYLAKAAREVSNPNNWF